MNSQSATNTKDCQLEKWLEILSSLQKCLFEISMKHIEKVEKCKFQENLMEI